MRSSTLRLLPALLAFGFGLGTSAPAAAQAQLQPIVIGQSLPLTGPAYPIANRIQAGAKAQVDRINASGGLRGRPIELVTLDDADDPKRLGANLRTLVQRGAIAIVNCLGEQACDAAAAATRELNVPLIGPFSGAASLRQPSVRHVFSLRPDDAHEAQALVRQLQSTGISRVALMVDGFEPAREQALASALSTAGVQATRIGVEPRPEVIDEAFRAVAKAAPQALVLNLGPAMLDALSRSADRSREGLPPTVATLSSAGLTQVTRLFRDRLIGYTSVVPNPEISQLPLVREFERDADAYVGPEAVSFEGLASYLHLRLCVEALRRAGSKVDGPRLADAIDGLGTLNLGGFRLEFGRERHQGSDHVEIGMRSRDGKLRR